MATQKKSPMKNAGINQARFEDNPKERAIAEVWEEENSDGWLLEYIMGRGVRAWISDRDRSVAATVIPVAGFPGRPVLPSEHANEVERPVKTPLLEIVGVVRNTLLGVQESLEVLRSGPLGKGSTRGCIDGAFIGVDEDIQKSLDLLQNHLSVR